jgi:hypothetical protein
MSSGDQWGVWDGDFTIKSIYGAQVRIGESGNRGLAVYGPLTSTTLTLPASHATDKIVMYSGGNEKIGTEANTLLLTADNLKLKDTAGHTNLVIDSSGNIISANYGKIQGDFSVARNGKLKFIYYYNPDGTRNLEFDKKKNLFNWTKDQSDRTVRLKRFFFLSNSRLRVPSGL